MLEPLGQALIRNRGLGPTKAEQATAIVERRKRPEIRRLHPPGRIPI